MNDIFEAGDEYAAVAVRRTHAMILTATCDIEGAETIAVFPVYSAEPAQLPAEIKPDVLERGGYVNLFKLPPHHNFGSAYINFTDIRNVAAAAIGARDRVAAVSREGQDEIVDRFIASTGRHWGHAANDEVPPLGKRQTGRFRCARCNLYDIPIQEHSFQPGARFPECENCARIHKSAQWYPLSQHRKS